MRAIYRTAAGSCLLVFVLALVLPGCGGKDGGGGPNPAPGELQFSSPAYSMSENAGPTTITVTRTGGSGGAVSVEYATSNGTAVAGTDYDATTGTLNWAAGDVADKTFTVPITDDALVQGDLTVNLTLTNWGGGASPGTPTTAVLTILEDDVPGDLQFSAAAYQVDENAGPATITVTRTGGSGGAVSVEYATSDGTAVAGTDYDATTGTLNWAAGDAADKTFTVPITDDALVQGDLTVNLTLTNWGGGASAGTPTTAVLTILEDDVPGDLQFSAAAYQVDENAGPATITVTRTGGSGGAVSVEYATSDGTAVAGTDYDATTGTLNWPAGDMTDKTFAVTVIDDAIYQGNLTVNLTLANWGGGASPGTPTTAVLTILEDDPSCYDLHGTASVYADPHLNWLYNAQNTGTGLLDSYEGDTQFECTGYCYDQALAVIAFTAAGEFAVAKLILDALQGVQRVDGSFYQGYSVITTQATQFLTPTGDNAWLILAVTYYAAASGDTSHLPMARSCADWLINDRQDPTDGAIWGMDGANQWKSMEENLDAYIAFRNLGVLTGDSFYTTAANAVLGFVVTLWDNGTGYFYRGDSDPLGASDANTLPLLALGTTGGGGEDYTRGLAYAEANLKTTDTVEIITGLVHDETWHGLYPGVVSLEQTAIYSRALAIAGDLAASGNYLAEVLSKEAANGGIPHTTQSTLPLGWPVYPLNSVAAAAWTYFAENSVNPMQ